MLDDLLENLVKYELNPLGYARWAYPWGEPGPLAQHKLKPWQEDALGNIGESLLRDPCQPIRLGRASGHGIGKSALSGILIDWGFNTCPMTRGVITANTENQLKTKTWVEAAKWNRLSLASPLNNFTATAIMTKDETVEREWRIDMVPWSERNTEAFAGLHNEGKRIFLLFDEASAIPDLIWEVAEGALTDENTQIIWIALGNPTRNSGRFRECMPDGKFGRRWSFKSIDSRTVEGTNKKQIKEWEEDYGEDSDWFKVRVRGIPPDSDGDSFISRADAVAATVRRPEGNENEDLILGVDCARQGADLSVIFPRRGRDAVSIPPRICSRVDSVVLTALVRDAIIDLRPTLVAIDESNIGGAVVDNLRYMNLPCMIYGVNFGAGPDGYAEEEVLNKRAEIYASLRKWLRNGGCIPEKLPGMADRSFIDELTATSYGFASKVRGRSDAIQLEKKKDLRKRLGYSPDFADALACTFAFPMPSLPKGVARPSTAQVLPDYDPLAISVEVARPSAYRKGRLQLGSS